MSSFTDLGQLSAALVKLSGQEIQEFVDYLSSRLRALAQVTFNLQVPENGHLRYLKALPESVREELVCLRFHLEFRFTHPSEQCRFCRRRGESPRTHGGHSAVPLELHAQVATFVKEIQRRVARRSRQDRKRSWRPVVPQLKGSPHP